MHFQTRQLTISLLAAGFLYACGGGGGSSTSTISLTGVAATGAAFTGATITVTDKTGSVVGTATVGPDGTYTVTLSAGAQAPFVLQASRTNAEGATESLVSVLPTVTGTSATVNVTPVTSLIAANLSPSGDPAQLASELASGGATITSSTVGSSIQYVQTILAPVLAATGTTATDPLYGSFQTNGTGYDQLLDSLKVTIIPATATSSNIEIGIKQQQADGDQPVVVQYSSSDTASTVTTNNNITSTSIAGTAVSSSTLLPVGTAQQIADHLAQLTTCYALPLSSRVSSAISGGVAEGTAADVLAPDCRNAFYGNDPATFLSNGAAVGRNASNKGAFASLFREAATGVVFSQGNYEFTRANGDIVISYKSRDTQGNETFDTFALRQDTDLKLKQIGNQYAYAGGVAAYHQIRRFPSLNQSASDYFSTGYNVNIPKIVGLNHVAVITPKGNTLIYMPQSGYDNLQLIKAWGGTEAAPTGGTPTGTSFIRIRSEYADTANTGDPAVTGDAARLFFASPAFSELQVSQIPAQAVWTLKYYSAPNAVPTVQYYKTRSRALTIAELRMQTWAELNSSQIAELQAASITPAGASGAGQVPVLDSRTSISMAYTVPNGALPPTSLQVWGKYNPAPNWGSASNFSDTVSIASTARSGNVPCVNSGVSDTHCTSGAYVNPTRINGMHLWSRDAAGREYANFYAWYQL